MERHAFRAGRRHLLDGHDCSHSDLLCPGQFRRAHRVIPPAYRRRIIRNNGDVRPTLLIDGYVAGVWQPADGGIEATAFDRLSDEACEGLEAEARALVALLADGETTIYRRYARWWATLTSAEVRVLGGGRSARGARRRGGAAARRAPS